MHVCTDSLGLYSHPKEFLGGTESEPMLTPRGIPSAGKKILPTSILPIFAICLQYDLCPWHIFLKHVPSLSDGGGYLTSWHET